jgi:hypothetical protein
VKGNEVSEGVPSTLHPFPENEPKNRLGLARWLTRPNHPLTARVIVNRVWAWHFGRGLVGTPSNFGQLGERPTHPELLDDLAARFVENGWSFSEVRGAQVIVTDLSGPLGTWKFYAQVVDEQDLILLYSVCPLRVPAERRPEVSQFLTGANYGLAAGNFELDFEDGEIRYKTVLHNYGDGLDANVLKRLVRSNGMAMETYLPGIGAVITGTPALPALERRTPQ